MGLTPSWTVAGGWGAVDLDAAGSELDERSTAEDIRQAQSYSGITEQQAFTLAGQEEPDPVGVGVGAGAGVISGGVNPNAGIEALLRDIKAGQVQQPYLPQVAAGQQQATATPMAFPLIAAGAFVGSRAVLVAIRAIAGRFLTVGVFRTLVSKFGPAAVKLAIGSLAFLGLSSLIEAGADDTAGVAIPRKKKRYSIGANPRVRTLAKVSGHCQRMLKRHEKVIKDFLPKKKVQYGIPPGKALSPIEKAAIRG